LRFHNSITGTAFPSTAADPTTCTAGCRETAERIGLGVQLQAGRFVRMEGTEQPVILIRL